ncbi:MAG: aminopeptidase [Magnetococcus sp. WYHC-3]
MTSRWTMAGWMALTLMLQGCGAGLSYYAQALGGQWELWRKARPVAEVLADPSTPETLRQRLGLVERLRHFARSRLLLPDGGSYRHYADLGRDHAVWVVHAAPPLDLTPVANCFPVVGCLAYRGYFDRARAQARARDLAGQGMDVFDGPVAAYSTLGWMDDPLLNTWIHWEEAALAGLIFHELAHEQLYVADDTAFNEGYAEAVGRIGTDLWLTDRGDSDARERWRAQIAHAQGFQSLVAAARQRLAALYAQGLPRDAALAAKEKELERLRQDYANFARQRREKPVKSTWLASGLNNARLNAVSLYSRWVPAFLELQRQVGGDMARFHAAAAALGRLPPAQREERLAELARGAGSEP